jgi:DNA-binding NtrC family response regulator
MMKIISEEWVVTAISSLKDYEVLQAGDPQVALHTAAKHSIDLLLSNCVLQSKTSGTELARKITASYSHVKVVLMSGHAGHDTLHSDHGWRFVQNSVSSAFLRATIIEVLRRPTKTGV